MLVYFARLCQTLHESYINCRGKESTHPCLIVSKHLTQKTNGYSTVMYSVDVVLTLSLPSFSNWFQPSKNSITLFGQIFLKVYMYILLSDSLVTILVTFYTVVQSTSYSETNVALNCSYICKVVNAPLTFGHSETFHRRYLGNMV